jgi:hypothetical protein
LGDCILARKAHAKKTPEEGIGSLRPSGSSCRPS